MSDVGTFELDKQCEALQCYYDNIHDNAYQDIKNYLGRDPTEEELEDTIQCYYDKFC